MVEKNRGRTLSGGLKLADGQTLVVPALKIGAETVNTGVVPTVNTVDGLSIIHRLRPVRVIRAVLAGVVISVPDTDFASLKLFDIPATNYILVGAYADLVGIPSGFTADTGNLVDFSLGHAAIADATFSVAADHSVMVKKDATGSTAVAVMKGASTVAESNKFIASGAGNSIYLNVVDPVTTSATGTLTVTGIVEVAIIDIGDPS